MDIDEQAGINASVWGRRSRRLVSAYTGRALRPPEGIILARYRDELAGRVLELGCGGGRLTGYLAELGGQVHAIDISEAMVEHCRRRYPEATYAVRDLRDLSSYADGSYDAVFAGFNVLDVLDDAERLRVLSEIHRILAQPGLLVLSSHNRASPIGSPWQVTLTGNMRRLPLRLLALPVRMRNRSRLRRLERSEPEYAIKNDEAHDFRLLHYYIGRDAAERQLRSAGFELLECLDGEGEPVAAGETASASPELHYVAARIDA